MFKLQKQKGKDLKILNLTDIHTENDHLAPDCKQRLIIEKTVCELIERVKPDLITLSGDQAWGGHQDAFRYLSSFIDGFNIPWTLVWGNHDQEKGYEVLEETVKIISESKNFLYEHGPLELGRGNFIIAVCEDDAIIEGIILMDTHNRIKYINKDGNLDWGWGKLYAEQIEWYKEQICTLKRLGCKETTVITHQPIYAYRYAIEAALKEGTDRKSVTIKQSYDGSCWNEGYKDSFGVNYEDVCCHLEDDHFFDTVTELGSTKHFIAGHDHVNCSSISYKGVRFTYGLKTGMGAYWRPDMNGGTVLTVGEHGITDVHHEFVDVSDI